MSLTNQKRSSDEKLDGKGSVCTDSTSVYYFTTKFFADISAVELYLIYTHVNQWSRPGPVFADTINSHKWVDDS